MKKSKISIPIIPELYQLTHNDFAPACVILGQAFQEDPIWKEILKNDLEKFSILFGVPLKYTLKYGRVYGSSSKLEGIAAWLHSDHMDMNFFRSIRSGAFMSALKLGRKIGKLIGEVFDIIVKDRESHMKGSYVYLYVIGVSPDHQNQGIGSKLINIMLDCLSPDLPIYLETETERNVRFYERLGFKVLKKITVPALGLPMWEMLHDRK